jgi:hypothetical protein
MAMSPAFIPNCRLPGEELEIGQFRRQHKSELSRLRASVPCPFAPTDVTHGLDGTQSSVPRINTNCYIVALILISIDEDALIRPSSTPFFRGGAFAAKHAPH